MSDEKNFNEENNEEITQEVAEAAAEEAAEEISDAVEEATEAVEADEDVAEEIAETESFESVLPESADAEAEAVSEDGLIAEPKKQNTGAVIAIIVAIVLVAALVVVGIVFGPKMFNKYNRQYVDVSGRTIAEVADEAGLELDEFLEQYGLPANMPSNTTESAAYNNIPVSHMATMYGMDFATMKEILKFPDDVTEETAWGEAIGKTTLGAYVGEDNLAEFKEYYGFGDEVTADTLWSEVRQTVDEKSREERIEAEKQSDNQKAEEDAADTTEDVTATEAPAEEAAEAPAAE